MRRRKKCIYADKYTVIYMKTDGTIFTRQRTTSPLVDDLKIGDYTGMGWRILDVLYYEKNKKEEYYVSLAQGKRFIY